MKLLAFCCTDTGIFGEWWPVPTGAATPCKEQHKNNQLWQFGLVNGFSLPVSQLLVMRRRGKAGGLVCFGSDAASKPHWGLSVAQCTANLGLAGRRRGVGNGWGSSCLPERQGQCKHHLPLQLYSLSLKSTTETTKHLPQD